MNVIEKLTLRHLWLNKRRTAVTIIGVILSVTMLGAIAVGISSFTDVMFRHTMKRTGEWHTAYHGIGRKQLQQLREDGNTKEILLEQGLGFSVLPGSENDYKPYLFLMEYNKSAMEKLPIELVEGRLPKNGNEVVISDHIRTNGGVAYRLGDTIELKLGDRVDREGKAVFGSYNNSHLFRRDDDGEALEMLKEEQTRTVTVVGICERIPLEERTAPGYTIFSLMDESKINPYSNLTARVIVNRVSNDIWEDTRTLADKLEVYCSFNDDLLRSYGVLANSNLSEMLVLVAGITGLIVIVGSIALIYNAFAISVSERSRYLGMVASVGATRKQKRHSVLFEGAVIGAISIPLGLLFAFIGMGVTFACVNPLFQELMGIDTELRLSVSWWAVAATVLVAVLTLWISTYRPAKRASRISPIDAIRQSEDVKMTARQVKTSKLTKKLFGFPGDIALKNLKRNKKRYRTTILSISMSVILFITVFSFLENFKQSNLAGYENINYDIEIYDYYEQEEEYTPEGVEEDNLIFDQIAALDEVEQSARTIELQAFAEIPEEQANQYLSQYYPDMKQENGTYQYSVQVAALDDASFAAAAKEAGVAPEVLQNGISALLLDKTHAIVGKKDDQLHVELNTLDIPVGGSVTIRDFRQQTKQKVTIAARLSDSPLGVTPFSDGVAHFTLIVSQSTAERMKGVTPLGHHMYLISNKADKLETELRELIDGTFSINNVYEQKQHANQNQILFSVFGYGFIVLITLICAANIFNTVSTSMALRKREFAMLRSVGMTPKQFNRMIRFESLFYGLKGLLYGLPVSLVIAFLLYKSFNVGVVFDLVLPWKGILVTVAAVFGIVGMTMLYAGHKLKKDNIVDTLRQENI